jgi:hypothetical protein
MRAIVHTLEREPGAGRKWSKVEVRKNPLEVSLRGQPIRQRSEGDPVVAQRPTQRGELKR